MSANLQVGKTQTVIALLVAAMLSMTEDAEIDIYANSAVARLSNARKFVSAMTHILEHHPDVARNFRHVRGTVANDSVIEYYNIRCVKCRCHNHKAKDTDTRAGTNVGCCCECGPVPARRCAA